MRFKNNLILQLNILCGLRAYTYLNDVTVGNRESIVFLRFPLAYPPIAPFPSLYFPPGLMRSEVGVGGGTGLRHGC